MYVKLHTSLSSVFISKCGFNYPGSRGPNVKRDRQTDSKRKTQRERPLASAIQNLTSMSVFGSDFGPRL